MRVSVVICTYNRADGLRDTLECLKLQRYSDFEVVVVNGPSTDHTGEVLADLNGQIRYVDNPLANLSSSRNLGIVASAGEIVAFIDDDALPEPSWLEQAVPAFADPDVAGVGGIVFDHSGMALQYRYSAATRFGEPVFTDRRPYDALCVPGAATFPYLQGTNSLFRRSALAEIGLFDETFDFYLDETDVCGRLVDAGYVLRQLDDAPVHHKYLPSARRNEAKVVTNWHSIVRNFVYFGYRHALHVQAGETEILAKANEFAEFVRSDAEYHENMGAVDPGHLDRATNACGPAIAEGIQLGRARAELRLGPTLLDVPEFVLYERKQTGDAMKIVLVSSGYPPELSGGISRFIADVAPLLAACGHEVRVMTKSSTVSTVDLEDGVWVHRLVPAATPGALPDAPEHIDGFATAVANEVARIEAWWTPDVAYGSLWDVEMLGIGRCSPEIPLVPMLATPFAEVALHEGWTDPEHETHDTFVSVVQLEREVIAQSAAVHAISDAIVTTFEGLYPGALDHERVDVAHIGRADEAIDVGPPDRTKDPMVLFVGRLEPRKGIDTFLDAVEVLLNQDAEARFVVAGDSRRLGPGGETYPAAWRRRGVAGGSRVEFLDMVSDAELSILIDESTVVVMPSRYESFGLVVVEAMIHGRAAVGSDVGGIAELIESGQTGVLTPVGDAERLADAISSLVIDRDLSAAIGARARLHYERHFTVELAAERLVGVLRRAIASRAVPTLNDSAATLVAQ